MVAKYTAWNKKVARLATKGELKVEKVKVSYKKVKVFYSSYFRGKRHFEDDATQNYLLFQPMYRYLKKIYGGDHISSWKSEDWIIWESIKPPTTSYNSLPSLLNYIGTKTRVKFKGQCLKQDKTTFTHGKTANIYIVLEIGLWDRGYDTRKLFVWCSSMSKNYDIDKCKYCGWGIGFNRRKNFSVANGFGNNAIICQAVVSSSVHLNKKKDI